MKVDEDHDVDDYDDQLLSSSSYASIKIKELMVNARVAELGSLASGAKLAMKIFVKRVFTTSASNASFLGVIANLQN